MKTVNLDPHPYTIQVRQDLLDPLEREEYTQAREGERLSDPAWKTFWDQDLEECVFSPRPEYSQVETDYRL